MKNKGLINNIEQIRDFWETCHRADSIISLSGVQYETAMGLLRLSDLIKPGINVLEAGVGMGYITKGLRENGANVSAIDISQTALDRVSKYCKSVYLVEDMATIPSDHFDVIVCCNMVQHVYTELLKQELETFLRSLNDDGVLALQFVSNSVHHDMGAEATLQSVRSGTLCRSPEFMEGLINELGGECKLVESITGLRKGKVNGNHIFHVTSTRKSAKKKDKGKNTSAQIRSNMSYNNPHDY